MLRHAGEILQRRRLAYARCRRVFGLNVEMLAQLLGGLLELLVETLAAINPEQFKPVVDGMARVGFVVLDQCLCCPLLKSH